MRLIRIICTVLFFWILVLNVSCGTAKTDADEKNAENTIEAASEVTTAQQPVSKPIDSATLPRRVFCSLPGYGHVQGIAIDSTREYMYFSFTRCFVKTDMKGNVIGSIENIAGHLGDIAYNPEDGLVYAAYEEKNTNHFYIATIDVSRINRRGLKITTGNIFSVVTVSDIVDDYTATVGGNLHRYGCSGIGCLDFGKVPGSESDAPSQLMIAYGVWSDINRTDNDYQILLQFDWCEVKKHLTPYRLIGDDAPAEALTADARYFVYTGNTTYGVQNLVYDPITELWLMTVYEGEKPNFPNYELYAVDASVAPVSDLIEGQPTPTMGLLLTLADIGLADADTGLRGWHFDCDGRGMLSLGDGYFYITDPASEDGTADTRLYRWVGGTQAFEIVD